MKLSQLVKHYYELAKKNNQEVIDVKLLFLKVLNLSNTSFYLGMDNEIDKDTINKVDELFNQYINGKPMAYIIGSKYFYKNEFIVNDSVLIPRNETEELVDWIIKDISNIYNSPKIIDIGCGSGVIGLSLALNIQGSEVYLSDISHEALIVCQENANKLRADVKIIHGDMLEPFINKVKVDVIVSNPPYIDRSELLDSSVTKHEPHLALYAKNKGLEFYERIIKDAYKVLNDEGYIYFEIGYKQKEDIENLIKNHLPNCKYEIRKDIYKNDRMVKIYYKV